MDAILSNDAVLIQESVQGREGQRRMRSDEQFEGVTFVRRLRSAGSRYQVGLDPKGHYTSA